MRKMNHTQTCNKPAIHQNEIILDMNIYAGILVNHILKTTFRLHLCYLSVGCSFISLEKCPIHWSGQDFFYFFFFKILVEFFIFLFLLLCLFSFLLFHFALCLYHRAQQLAVVHAVLHK